MCIENLTQEKLKRQLEMLAMPVDFDQLCKEGILQIVKRKGWYKVLEMRRLPEHVKIRICEIESGGLVKFEDTVARAK